MCLLKAIIAWPPKAAVRSSDVRAARDRMPKHTHYSHGHFPRSVFECPVGGLLPYWLSVHLCPGLHVVVVRQKKNR